MNRIIRLSSSARVIRLPLSSSSRPASCYLLSSCPSSPSLSSCSFSHSPTLRRQFSIFSSEGPDTLGSIPINSSSSSARIPLGAPSPNVLNRLRVSARTPPAGDQVNQAEEKYRKAIMYKQNKSKKKEGGDNKEKDEDRDD